MKKSGKCWQYKRRQGLIFTLILFLPFCCSESAGQGYGRGIKPRQKPSCFPQELQITELDKALKTSDSIGRKSGRIDKSSIRFGWPLRWQFQNSNPGKSYFGLSNYVDLNPAFPGIRDFNCGTRSYNLPGYSHKGTDYYPWPGWWLMMDMEEVDVVAAAKGIIVYKVDGQFDRQCQFNSSGWNVVYLRHADSLITWYGHLKKNSVTTLQVGDSVQEGEYLGKVGSSGNSTGPHLHFEVYKDGVRIDPYAGPCNPGQISFWKNQHPYFNRDLIRSFFTSGEPEFPPCPQQEILKEDSLYNPGDSVYFTNYYRDLVHQDTTLLILKDPENEILDSILEIHDLSPDPFWDAGGWLWKWGPEHFSVPGRYTMTSFYKGESMKATFWYAAQPLRRKGFASGKKFQTEFRGDAILIKEPDLIQDLVTVVNAQGIPQKVNFSSDTQGWIMRISAPAGLYWIRGLHFGYPPVLWPFFPN